MKRKLVVAMTALTVAQLCAEEKIVLTSPLIDLIDGKPYAIDGEVYGLMLRVRRKIRKLLFGSQTADGKSVGSYTFEGKPYSVTELAALEAGQEHEFATRRDELETTKHQYSEAAWEKAVEDLEQDFALKKQKMRTMLELIKADFLEMTARYMKTIRFKEQLLVLIQESCDRRHNENCFLLKWGEEERGKEGELLKKELITFKGFEKFCIDLSNYLEDMARSCPKGRAQFTEWLKTVEAKKKGGEFTA